MFEEPSNLPGSPAPIPAALEATGIPSVRAQWVSNGLLTDIGFEAIPKAIPNAGLAANLAKLDLSLQSDCELFEILRAWSRIESWVASQKAKVVAAAAPGLSLATPDGFGITNPERESVAVALTISPRAAETEIGFARSLADANHLTRCALESGQISVRGARVVVEETADLADAEVAEVEARILPRASVQVPSELRRSCRRAVHSVAPQQEEAKAVRATEDRCVTLTPASSGMAYLEALLPASKAQVIFNVLTEAARIAKGRDLHEVREAGLDSADLPSLGAYRADALSALVTSEIPDLVRRGIAPTLVQAHVVLDLATALGIADNPGELRGYGPIPGSLARELASDASWERWVTSTDDGHLVDIGTAKYRPSARFRALVNNRDQRCRFPGCSAPAQQCDVDHADPWHSGGATSPANLGALCRRHHRMKTHTRWQLVDSQVDGTCTWVTPTGHRITAIPEPILPDPPTRDRPD